MNATEEIIESHILAAIKEDLGDGDHTSLATIPSEAKGTMQLLVKEAGIIAGVAVAQKVFKLIDPETAFEQLIPDGKSVEPGDIVFKVKGKVVSMLSAERLALNYMQRMSGIATKTAAYKKLLRELPTVLLDTRKTTPGLRIFEKIAVAIGGGANHRFGLFDMILIKNNHVDFAGGIAEALKAVDNYLKKHQIEIPVELEVRNFDELEKALQIGGFKRIMLDNFSPENLRKAVVLINGRFETEASGGITETTIYDYAATGVDYISVGALTHHIKSLDLSLRAIKA
ncbi:MAG: carboxylating nicotinate-nucleotide diphosphorylase [Bacteroidales bacterium]|jgi:nicotinate-nucleotide pyrophosphorylase (carboxylating)|nr:carboxylating nicotinate-nucleotide diphosphorylase [Bacteroidales bacterium]